MRFSGSRHLRVVHSTVILLAWITIALLQSTPARAQFKARLPAGPNTPAWYKGIEPINRESYWNAVECGKQGGAQPVCLFYDADLCKNDEFTLALFTPYKAVAYEVWLAVRKNQPVPTPHYGNASRMRISLGVTPAKGSKNAITAVAIKRGGRVVKPATQSLDNSGGGQFIFDFAVFAPTTGITIEMVGRGGTRTCTIPQDVLTMFR